MEPVQSISIFVAFLAGFLSFVSPCVLPLIPSYVTFITGMTLEEFEDESRRKEIARRVIIHSIVFIIGFSTVFILMGASATYIGALLTKYQTIIRQAGGILVIFFGLYITEIYVKEPVKKVFATGIGFAALAFLFNWAPDFKDMFIKLGAFFLVLYSLMEIGIVKLDFLLMEKKIEMRDKPMGLLGTFLVGVTFAAGWTPCIGPILGSILVYASVQTSIIKGVILLTAYSLGLGIPFFLSSIIINSFFIYFQKFRKWIRPLTIISGVLLIIIGVLLYTNYFTILSGLIESAGGAPIPK